MSLRNNLKRTWQLQIKDNFIIISIVLCLVAVLLIIFLLPRNEISKIFYILLGSILALAGSFSSMLYKEYKDQLKKDQATWYKIAMVLQKIPKFRDEKGFITGKLDRAYALGKDVETGAMTGVKEKSEKDSGRAVSQELSHLILKIRSKRYFALATNVWKFVTDVQHQTNEELDMIKEKSIEAANEGFIKYYENLEEVSKENK